MRCIEKPKRKEDESTIAEQLARFCTLLFRIESRIIVLYSIYKDRQKKDFLCIGKSCCCVGQARNAETSTVSPTSNCKV